MASVIIIIVLLSLFDALLFISCWALERDQEERDKHNGEQIQHNDRAARH